MALPASIGGLQLPSESALTAEELSRRPSRAPDERAERRMFSELSSELLRSPDTAAQRLSEAALALCQAHSAGFGTTERHGARINWRALAGRWTSRHPPAVAESLQRPVYVNGEIFGTLYVVAHDATRRFDSEDLRLLTSLAAFASATLQGISTTSTGARRQMRFLLQLTDALRALADPIDIQAEASRRLGEFLDVNRVNYATIEGEHSVIRRGYVRGVTPMVGRFPIKAFGDALTKDYRHGKPILVNDVDTDPRLTPADRERYHAAEIAAFCVVTLVKHGRTVAAFGANNATPRTWTPEEVDLTREVAERTWAALERAVAEAALRESEEKYRTLFASMDEGFGILEVLFGEDGRPIDVLVLEANEAWHRHSGAASDWLDMLGHVARTGQPLRREQYCPAVNRWFSTYAVRIGDDDSRQVAVIVNDITDVRQAQETLRHHADQFETLLNQAPLGVYLVDTDLCILAANPIARSLFDGLDGGAIGRDIGEIVHAFWGKDLAGEVLQIFRHTLETGEPFIATEVAGRRVDRPVMEHYEWRLNRIILPDGRFGVVCYFREISQQVRDRELLREADRRKNEFLAMLAHELRNPLAPIRTSAQILQRMSGGNATVETAADMLGRQVGQMARLVDDLVDVSRITRGRVELRREHVELTSVVSQVLESFRPHCDTTGQELTITRPVHLIYVNADPARLAQIVGNLLSNACKYTDRNGRIAVTVAREGSDALIRVRDNGIGIAPDQLPRIFDLFTQVDTSLERSQSGLGIGLTLVKTLVEMHNGSVEVSSDGLGRGSEFVVRLPAVVDQPEQQAAGKRSDDERPGIRQRVLVVDDNRDAAQSLAMLLEMTGHEVHTAYDGESAVADAASLQPDVILLDIGLPKLNGYEAARQIRAQQGARPLVLIALTGWGQEEDRRRSEEAGFDAHLVKPVDHNELAKLLQELAGGG